MVYNASSNELVRTKTLVNCIILVDSTPFRQWYEAHDASPLRCNKGAKLVCFSWYLILTLNCSCFIVLRFAVVNQVCI